MGQHTDVSFSLDPELLLEFKRELHNLWDSTSKVLCTGKVNEVYNFTFCIHELSIGKVGFILNPLTDKFGVYFTVERGLY